MPTPKLSRDTCVKTSTENKRYTMDFSDELEAGETITGTPTWAFAPTGPTAANKVVSPDGLKAQATISGGTSGLTYIVSVTCTTSGGETLVGQGTLIVED